MIRIPGLARRPLAWGGVLTLIAMLTACATEKPTSSNGGGGGTLDNPGAVASVTITPKNVALAPTGTQGFQAVALTGAGDTAHNTLTWQLVGKGTLVDTSTTGGTHASHVQAGADTGQSMLIATVNTLADTAFINVTSQPVASIVVAPADASVTAGGTVQLQASVTDASGAPLSGRKVTWSSSAGAIATVNGSGLVTGVASGSATITATCEGRTASAAITVTGSGPPPPPPPTGGCPGAWPSGVYPRMPLSTGQAFYVSPGGSDANPGTIDQPWQTLQKAFDALQPGQIAYLRAGTYGSFCSASTFRRAGTLTAPITVQGYAGERAVLHGQIRIDGSYFRLSNIVAEGPTCGTWGATTRQGDNMILMTPGLTHNVEVSSSEVYHDGWHAGISAGGDDIWILNNYIHDNGGFNDTSQINTSHGIYYHGGTRGVVANNILEHNRAKGLSARFTANHILVINNTVVGNGRSGMDVAESTYAWTFVNNVVMNNGNVNDGVGINTGGSAGGATNIEINNILWNNGTSGTSNWDANATVTNNVVADPLLANPVSSAPSTTHQGYSNDYHLKSGSPAIDFASVLYALPFDFGGVCRPKGQGPDAGAIEQQ
ncbi:MAG TPA: Ig-like domain-containing protein [Gemmatimonadales bacterium]|nr:Ig-like domain-containing protein [Gemmatimonadales bacterium]